MNSLALFGCAFAMLFAQFVAGDPIVLQSIELSSTQEGFLRGSPEVVLRCDVMSPSGLLAEFETHLTDVDNAGTAYTCPGASSALAEAGCVVARAPPDSTIMCELIEQDGGHPLDPLGLFSDDETLLQAARCRLLYADFADAGLQGVSCVGRHTKALKLACPTCRTSRLDSMTNTTGTRLAPISFRQLRLSPEAAAAGEGSVHLTCATKESPEIVLDVRYAVGESAESTNITCRDSGLPSGCGITYLPADGVIACSVIGDDATTLLAMSDCRITSSAFGGGAVWCTSQDVALQLSCPACT